MPGVQLLLVDDGSNDGTLSLLNEAQRKYGKTRVEVLALKRNAGKGEAVRQGLIWLQNKHPTLEWAGFIDADGAISVADVKAMQDCIANHKGADMIWSSRVALAGRVIERSSSRHYIARTFATLIGLFEPALPYDTQSGLKLFSANSHLKEVLSQPFKTRWLFEIEMLIRWKSATRGEIKIWEVPLTNWRDVRGSKVANFKESSRLLFEILLVIGLARQANKQRVN